MSVAIATVLIIQYTRAGSEKEVSLPSNKDVNQSVEFITRSELLADMSKSLA